MTRLTRAFLALTSVTMCACALGVVGTHPTPAGSLRYRFSGMKSVVYQVATRVEFPDSFVVRSGQVYFTIAGVDADNGQLTFSYRQALKDQSYPMNADGGGAPDFPPAVEYRQPSPAAPSVVMNAAGQVVRSDDLAAMDRRIIEQGQEWSIPLPPLPDNKEDVKWHTQQHLTLSTKSQGNRWGGRRGPWQETDRVVDESVDYSVDKTDGALIDIACTYDLASLEKVGNQPYLHETGTGTYRFDKALGIVRSVDMNVTIEVNEHNATVRVPVKLSARLLDPDETAKLQQAAQEQQAQQASGVPQTGLQPGQYLVPPAPESETKWTPPASGSGHDASDPNWEGPLPANADNTGLPDGCARTHVIGAHNSGPYVKVDRDKRSVIGMGIIEADWGGQKTMRFVQPLWDKPQSVPPGEIVVMAKPGYAVGGIILCGDAYADGFRVIFMKIKDKALDPQDAYITQWLGRPTGNTYTILGGRGQRIVGTCGEQGMNNHALGLVVDTSTPAVVGN